MDFPARLQELAEKIHQTKELVQTEQATKSALIMPFLQLLGYDVFNPAEVVPEYTADVGIKKGEKADFAILRDGQPVMLIECKCCGAALDAGKCSQLFRYFHTIPTARIGILTDGIRYLFFADLDKPNVMDQRPFMEFDMLAPDKALVSELLKLTKTNWDMAATLSAATELKYTTALKSVLAAELLNPGDDLVRLLANKVYDGTVTAKIRELFSGLTQRAFQQLVNDMINDRLTSAMIVPSKLQDTTSQTENTERQPEEPLRKVHTTEEEHEGFHLVKAILRRTVDPKRIIMRDNQSYCGVLLDDNNRKPLCRLHFNGKQKYLGLFTADKTEERVPIATIDDIYTHADRLRETVGFYG
ncbi:MAG: type I restriction enzyme HsdR N-terminal domain-containing protein [Proteobacteria bacterium]|nr:type I restriction enzyme HsdR N-terminal domain-containing protein [Pseudomonadota bacterium]MBU1595642.1 type I restriction enzyme HsdR N-terminal domain-containing protein [Pseudomonadota bacterium]